jgi:DNA repair protein RadC
MKTYKSLNYKYSLVRETNNKYHYKIKVSSPEHIYEYIKHIIPQIPDINVHENFLLISLNRANNTNGWICISTGSEVATVVSPKLCCLFAIESLSSGIIIAHNHPSGYLVPSQSDKDLTNTLKKSLSILDITLMDHIIYSEDRYYSFLQNDLI